MKKLLSLLIALIFIMAGCGEEQSKNEKENVSGKPKNTHESKQVDDFKVSIDVEDDLNVFAAITYVGEADEIDIYHGGSIFFFNIFQQDGNFEYESAMTQPLLTTALVRDEPHSVKFEGLERLNLKPGTYEFEAIADISLDSDDVVGTQIKIPVSKIKVIE
ncbi:hypothetical protein CSV72_11680 [Sporosarcina sp. P20a]|uniref:hypothetical protein n=1 Tax=Sporosarcina sp. P20a TaxID=2048256 RepID=UPI000C16B115|nr:hypothetical protein [Sporosarcina sp. P20a]PIC85867.1 hypothetical protein CSV72_11680 [Sporosarcina sp. P20a]